MLLDLIEVHQQVTQNVPEGFKRYLYNKINWNQRMIAITGARGVGKTTMVLQHYKAVYRDVSKCLYLSGDNPLVIKDGIYNLGTEYFRSGGKALIIDEIHKSPEWSLNVKGLYDAFPDKQLIILGSSKTEILRSKGDLSRRTLIYNLKPLSFREYLNFTLNTGFKTHSILSAVKNHTTYSQDITRGVDSVLQLFNTFKQKGSIPFSVNYSQDEYYNIMRNLLDKIIYEDISLLHNMKKSSAIATKKLISYLAESKIPTINVSSLCNDFDISRDTFYSILDSLQRADLLKIISLEKKKHKSVSKGRVFFNSPNWYYTLAKAFWTSAVDVGNLREAFFVSQLPDESAIYSSETTDYDVITDDGRFSVEIGGKGKSRKQLSQDENGFLFKDDIEVGFQNIIPLYLCGFQY
jgi:hypothetical protein